jgi:hypothetical protein
VRLFEEVGGPAIEWFAGAVPVEPAIRDRGGVPDRPRAAAEDADRTTSSGRRDVLDVPPELVERIEEEPDDDRRVRSECGE